MSDIIKFNNPTLTPLIDWEKTQNSVDTSLTTKCIVKSDDETIKAIGQVSDPSKDDTKYGAIYLKQSYEDFDGLYVKFCGDAVVNVESIFIPMWQFKDMMNTTLGVNIVKGTGWNPWSAQGLPLQHAYETLTNPDFVRPEVWHDLWYEPLYWFVAGKNATDHPSTTTELWCSNLTYPENCSIIEIYGVTYDI